MATERKLAAGTRVRLRSSSQVVELRSATGTVVRPDRYDGYYVIKLDQPAAYFAADGTTRDLPELVEAVDNLDVLSDPSYVIISLADDSFTRMAACLLLLH